ncbi:MAG: NAD(P)/FAD-dependent oxidoreductase [Planctomycetes bacterium]|nr:NAD(P)/FAD-dependent oxidoreductase [Planctomycetota bacterium]
MKQFDIIVIGAGQNGLTAAAMLAKAGRKVVVLERRDIIGGLAASEEFHPGFRTTGPLHEAKPNQMVVDALQLSLNDGVSRTGAWTAAGAQTIDALTTALSLFVTREPPELGGNLANSLGLLTRGISIRRLGRDRLHDLLRIPPMCAADWLDEICETKADKPADALRAIAGSFTGPRSPGTAGSLLWDLTLSTGQARCSPPKLIAALETAARNGGVEIRTGAKVSRIRIANGRIAGVTLTGGDEIDAPVVAASCDPKTTFLKLLAPSDVPSGLGQHIRSYRMNGVTAKINLAIKGPLRFTSRPELDVERAVIAESLDDIERAFDAVKYRQFSQRPVLDICVPTVANPELAPEGHSVVSILVYYAPYDLEGGWTDQQRDKLGDTVVNVLKDYVPDIESKIIAREVLTPLDIEARYGVTGGHIHHGDHTLDQLIVRPCPECARYETPIDGLYLCGSGSHPGGGLTCMPGFLAAQRMLKRRRT